MTDADVIIIGAGLAGLVAAIELANAGKRVIVLDQESQRDQLVAASNRGDVTH
jgi:predicted oxidoreductase